MVSEIHLYHDWRTMIMLDHGKNVTHVYPYEWIIYTVIPCFFCGDCEISTLLFHIHMVSFHIC